MLSALIVACAGFLGSYLGGYFKKKGENLATKGDLDKLLVQVSVVTATTKAIEAQISDRSWGWQRKWEMKREAIAEAFTALERAEDSHMQMFTAFEHSPFRYWETKVAWNKAMIDLDARRSVIELFCSKAMTLALQHAAIGLRTEEMQLSRGQLHSYEEVGQTCIARRYNALLVARKELGLDSDQQSVLG